MTISLVTAPLALVSVTKEAAAWAGLGVGLRPRQEFSHDGGADPGMRGRGAFCGKPFRGHSRGTQEGHWSQLSSLAYTARASAARHGVSNTTLPWCRRAKDTMLIGRRTLCGRGGLLGGHAGTGVRPGVKKREILPKENPWEGGQEPKATVQFGKVEFGRIAVMVVMENVKRCFCWRLFIL